MLPHVEAMLSRARELYEGRGGDPPVTKVILLDLGNPRTCEHI